SRQGQRRVQSLVSLRAGVAGPPTSAPRQFAMAGHEREGLDQATMSTNPPNPTTPEAIDLAALIVSLKRLGNDCTAMRATLSVLAAELAAGEEADVAALGLVASLDETLRHADNLIGAHLVAV